MPILQKDSIITRAPSSLAPRERVWLEGIGFSIAIADLAFERMRELLWLLTEIKSPEVLGATIPAALSDAWTFVDSVHRLGDLLNMGLHQFKTPELTKLRRTFETISKTVFDLRNAVQHIGTESRALESSGVPVWGVLSWAAIISTDPPKLRCCALMPAGGGPTITNELVNSLGLPFRARVDHIHLDAFGVRVSLADVYWTMASFAQKLEHTLNERLGSDPRQFPGGILAMDIVPATEESQPQDPNSTT